MAKDNYITTNKYGKTVFMPKTEGTSPERIIIMALDDIGIHSDTLLPTNNDGLSYRMGFFFDETGLRRKKYDIAIMKDKEPVLLIEYDGECHYDENFFEDTGVRPERCTAHVIRSGIGEAIKTALAYSKGIPYLRMTKQHLSHIRDLLIAYIEIVVNKKECLKNANTEVIMIDMLEKWGWDFDYIPPSDPSKAEKERIARLYSDYEN